ncbi:hypothetical protein D9599_22710 [Roseomonas sp. KE2513]|uniref:RNA polymerase sigma factor region1.1 domain-containing protein n=1 Tax=Roseomonas sp. KE2513 TaxID=2479202 RepID=UPI0018E044A0|nr:RNA polymerase sigma factor region1.1 domain-containing protein [Roseomonas sp. KE2513]MBI0538380.1 hypothetical protein [Roseomonas sp. KE2513]
MAVMEPFGELVLDEREVALLSSLPDAEDQALRHLIAIARTRGHVNHAEVSAALPSDQLSSDRIEDALGVLSAIGVEITDEEEVDEEVPTEGTVTATETDEEPAGNAKEESGGSADPVRMYLRDMGTLTLLSREGEIAIAKRIESGRSAMIEGLCEAPLVLDAILGWYRAVQDGSMLLRDVLDLEATAGAAEGVANETADPDDDEVGDASDVGSMVTPSVLEQQVKPEAMAAFEAIDAASEVVRGLQARRMAAYVEGHALGQMDEAEFTRLRGELVALVGDVHLHANRISELVERLREINKRLMGAEGRLLRIAETAGVKREDFLALYHRGGSVCLNSSSCWDKWSPAGFRPPRSAGAG